jgi:hypothetical protein
LGAAYKSNLLQAKDSVSLFPFHSKYKRLY